MDQKELVITADAVYDGLDYQPRPGLVYEIADGVRVKTKRHSVGRIDRMEQIARDFGTKRGEVAQQAHVLDMILEQARVLVDPPEGFNWNRDTVDSTVAQRMVDDAFFTAYLTSRMPSASAAPSSEAGAKGAEENQATAAAPTS